MLRCPRLSVMPWAVSGTHTLQRAKTLAYNHVYVVALKFRSRKVKLPIPNFQISFHIF